jgi:GxxExxY protein
MHINQVTGKILECAFRIHSAAGPGMLESVYETLLEHELVKAGLAVKRQWPIPVVYQDIKLEDGFRADLIVEDRVIVEIKAFETLAPVHFKQVTSYLRFAGITVALLINFNVESLRDGVHRVVYQFPE